MVKTATLCLQFLALSFVHAHSVLTLTGQMRSLQAGGLYIYNKKTAKAVSERVCFILHSRPSLTVKIPNTYFLHLLKNGRPIMLPVLLSIQ